MLLDDDALDGEAPKRLSVTGLPSAVRWSDQAACTRARHGKRRAADGARYSAASSVSWGGGSGVDAAARDGAGSAFHSVRGVGSDTTLTGCTAGAHAHDTENATSAPTNAEQ